MRQTMVLLVSENTFGKIGWADPWIRPYMVVWSTGFAGLDPDSMLADG